MPKAKIFFIKNNEQVPFSQFLKNEKMSRGITWREMDKLCGTNRMNAYVLPSKNRAPNNPTKKAFERIVKSLGYSLQDFQYESLIIRHNHIKRNNIEDDLRYIGDKLLQLNKENLGRGKRPQKFSTPAIKKFLGERFYQIHGKGFVNTKKLYEQLKSLDSKYSSIELQHQVQPKRIHTRYLDDSEKDFIETSILKHINLKGLTNFGRLPSGTFTEIAKELNEFLLDSEKSPRTDKSVQYHIDKIWRNKKKMIKLKSGSPLSTEEKTKQLLEEKLEEIQEDTKSKPELNELSSAVIDNEQRLLRKRRSFEYAPIGHVNMIMFLMNPDNYTRFISRDIILFDVDFPFGEVDEKLFSVYKEELANLKLQSKKYPDDADVINFVDSWLRCDMIFRKQGGGFVVIEVKQCAIDKPNGFKNATKACQQLSAYTAVILDNILRHNLDNASKPNYKVVKESVEGYLVAYEMEKSIENHLNRAGNKRPVIIPKEIVNDYINKLQIQ